MSPAYSPWAPELGWKLIWSYPVISQRSLSSSSNSSLYPRACSGGQNGWMLVKLGKLQGIISAHQSKLWWAEWMDVGKIRKTAGHHF